MIEQHSKSLIYCVLQERCILIYKNILKYSDIQTSTEYDTHLNVPITQIEQILFPFHLQTFFFLK